DLAAMAAEYDCFQASPGLNDESPAAIVNLEPFLAADTSVRKDDFFSSVLDQFVYQGQLWGLPGNVSVSLVNYNKELFDAAGLAYPTADWTTSDFLEMAVALTHGSGEDEQYGYVPMFSEANDLITILDRLGANLLDESEDPPRVVLSSPEAVEAFRWYTSLVTQYHVQPVFDDESGDPGLSMRDRMALIDEGRAAMWLSSGSVRSFTVGRGEVMVQGFAESADAADSTRGVAPLPAGPNSAQGSGFQSVDGYFISAQSDARQACWTWISFLTQHVTSTSGLPARRSVAESAEYRQLVGEERAEATLASVNSGSKPSIYQRISDEGNWIGFSSLWLSDAYERVIDGEATVEEALADAQEMSDKYRDCIIANDAFQDPQAMSACLSESGMNLIPEMP
ncbi:MAG: extracellular solute-binding protein, partial [Chloroflexi bacterium]